MSTFDDALTKLIEGVQRLTDRMDSRSRRGDSVETERKQIEDDLWEAKEEVKTATRVLKEAEDNVKYAIRERDKEKQYLDDCQRTVEKILEKRSKFIERMKRVKS